MYMSPASLVREQGSVGEGIRKNKSVTNTQEASWFYIPKTYISLTLLLLTVLVHFKLSISQEHHADLLARHSRDCLCTDCTSDHDEFDPIVRRDLNVLLPVGPRPNLQAPLEPHFGSSIRSVPAAPESRHPFEADDMPSTSTGNAF